MRRRFLTLVFLSIFAMALRGEFRLDPVFTSNMVLQQGVPMAFFGSCDLQSRMTVTFDGQFVTVSPDDKGQWRAEFPAMTASSESHTVKVSDGKSEVLLTDVLVGDVWLCSGQSNMQMPVGSVYRRGWSAFNCEKEVASAGNPLLRYAVQRLVYSHMKPLEAQYADGNGWVKTSPSVASWFSATAYFFGRQLQRDVDLPIGLLVSTWRGTRIQPWISQGGYEAGDFKAELAQIKRFTMTDERKSEYEAQERSRLMRELNAWLPMCESYCGKDTSDFSGAEVDISKWPIANTDWSPQYCVTWLRKEFTLDKSMKNGSIAFTMSKPAQSCELFLNGSSIASWKITDDDYSESLWVTLPADRLKWEGKNSLAIRALYVYRPYTRNLPAGTLVCGNVRKNLPGGWRCQKTFQCTSKELGRGAPAYLQMPYAIFGEQYYSNLYNGMIDAWTKLPIKGVIWYQGCSNAGDMHYYRLLTALIADWRAKWKQPELPFIIVQLAGYEPAHAKDWQTADPNKPSGYALTRDIQRQVADTVPCTGLAVAIDIGEADNIHPGNKQEVGRRLALQAERIAYGMDVPCSGPVFKGATPEGNAIRVAFTHGEGLKTADGKAPGAFAVAGDDGTFVWASARIEGETVVVSSPDVPAPKFVRYAYAGYRGDCNLQNGAGLPAGPFRSDAVDYVQAK